MASTLPGEPSAHPADEAQALRDEIEQTREHLGDTVDQLAAKADVKKQARAGAARLGERVRGAVPREQRGRLAAAVGALVAALAALLIWKRRKRS
jgi:LPXTG-motif cell wall-anchored protein